MEIEIEGIKKFYGRNQVLNINRLHIEKGKITGIIGPNGSGKTTLLNIIGGLDRKCQGRVLYNKKKLCKKTSKNITSVFQKPYLLRRSVYENIEYPLKIRRIDKGKAELLVNKIMDDLEIRDLRDKKANKLSGGESQKVALARALVFKPRLLLLDEPTSNIDPEYIKTMEERIIKFNKEDKGTVLIVTHNIEQSKRLSHNIIELRKGQVVN